jgi:hypothetical protein
VPACSTAGLLLFPGSSSDASLISVVYTLSDGKKERVSLCVFYTQSIPDLGAAVKR